MEKLELDKDTAQTFQGGKNGGSSGGGGASSGGGSSGGSFTELGLQAHNMFRKIHGTPPMKLDAEMSKGAEEYAKKLAAMGTLQHAKTEYGENLAMKCSSRENDLMTAQEATKNWYVSNICLSCCLNESQVLLFCTACIDISFFQLNCSQRSFFKLNLRIAF